ncbi:MAG: hypothetical protein Q8N63_06480, partial [Nanoarchaeota archaeon]|nr:hypothetical protein [Nanoarchaeota archaeon]
SNDTYAVNTTLAGCINITTVIWSEGQHNVIVYVNDSLNNVNSSFVRFTIDTTAPSLSIIYPSDGAGFTSGVIDLNFTVSDSGVGLSSCWYKNNTGENITIACGTNTTISQGSDGAYTIYMWANDTLNNVASHSHTWTVSTDVPATTLIKPDNDKWFNNISNIYFNFTATDSNGIDTCELWGNWTGTWHKNQTKTFSGDTSVNASEGFFIQNISDGVHSWNIWCNDTAAPNKYSFAALNRTFGIDTIYPQINLTYPTNISYASIQTQINYTRSDLNIVSCWYSLDNGITNSTPDTNCYNFSSLNSGQGSKTWVVYINDSAGNENSSLVSFTVDTISPDVAIVSPANNTNSSDTGLDVNYTRGSDVQSCWYSNDTYAVNTTLAGCINITTVTWSEGQHNVTVWVNDSAGNKNSSFVRFTIDTIKPNVNLLYPLNI